MPPYNYCKANAHVRRLLPKWDNLNATPIILIFKRTRYKLAERPMASDSDSSETFRRSLEVLPPCGNRADKALAACIPCFTAELSSKIRFRASHITNNHCDSNVPRPNHSETTHTTYSSSYLIHRQQPAMQTNKQQNHSAKQQIVLDHDPPCQQPEPQPLRSTSS